MEDRKMMEDIRAGQGPVSILSPSGMTGEEIRDVLESGVRALPMPDLVRRFVPVFLGLEKVLFREGSLPAGTDPVFAADRREELRVSALASFGVFSMAILDLVAGPEMKSLELVYSWNLADKAEGKLVFRLSPAKEDEKKMLELNQGQERSKSKGPSDGAVAFTARTALETLTKTTPEERIGVAEDTGDDSLEDGDERPGPGRDTRLRILGYFAAGSAWLVEKVFEYRRLEGADYPDMLPPFDWMATVRGADGKNYEMRLRNEPSTETTL